MMEGRQRCRRPRNRSSVMNPTIEPDASRTDSEHLELDASRIDPEHVDAPRVNLEHREHDAPRADPGHRGGWDQELDERLIAAYERGRWAERHERGLTGQERSPGDEFRRLYDAFMRLAPPKFDGMGGYSVAEEWIASVKAKFIICRVPEANKVELVEQLLEGSARYWWDGTKLGHQGYGQEIPWQWFKGQFGEQFLSDIHREALRRQFLTLRQQGRSITEYNQTFFNLSRYAPDLRENANRYRRQYLDGLDPEVALAVDHSTVVGVPALMKVAEQAEIYRKRSAQQAISRSTKQKGNYMGGAGAPMFQPS